MVYSHDVATDTYSYEHIAVSPITLELLQRNFALYCEYADLLDAGFGFTENSFISDFPPQVISSEEFTVQVSALNKVSR